MPLIHTVSFTGHRAIPREHMLALPGLIEEELNSRFPEGKIICRLGGAQGFDTLAVMKLFAMREQNGRIFVDLFLPCPEQDSGWRREEREQYRYILSQADRIRYTSPRYHGGCMLERDRQMVDGSDLCVAYCMRSRGGSFYTLSYAQSQGVEVTNLGLAF